MWSQNDIEILINDKYANLLPIYNSYPFFIQKVDMAKYIILYEYGGMYLDVDLDIKSSINQLPLDKCIIARSPKLNVNIFSKCISFLPWTNVVNNNFLYLPYAKHPLCKLLIDNLHVYSCRYFWEFKAEYIFRSTGPLYLMKMLDIYLKTNDVPYYVNPETIFHDMAENSWNKMPIDIHDIKFILFVMILIFLIIICFSKNSKK